MSKQRFYINTQGNDDITARSRAIEYAINLAQSDTDINRIILLIHSKHNDGWFRDIFDENTVKKLFNGIKFSNCRVPIKIETSRTYKETYSKKPSEIVIVFGMDNDQLVKIEDYFSIKVIILIPWLKENVMKWIKTWNPIEISGNVELNKTYPEPSDVVKRAMFSLTAQINMSTGISHPTDEELAKTYILALHKYEKTLDANIVGAYLVKELKWQTANAAEIETLINTLNAGKYFKGGRRTGLREIYKSWEAK